jgi:hypothetical protein
MDEQDNGKTKKLISALLAGIALGVLMAIVVLLLMRLTGFSSKFIMIFIIAVVACVLPACFDFLGNKPQLNLWIIDMIMIGLGFLLGILYANTAALTDTTRARMLTPICIVYGTSLGFTAIRLFYKTKKRGKAE